MFQIVKDNWLYFLIVIVVFAFGFKVIPPQVTKTMDIVKMASTAKSDLTQKQATENNLRIQAELSNKAKAPIVDGKKIYELEGTQFSPEASFAPLFEVVLTIAQNSGVRIRSIDYNYAPEADPIYASRLPEYNVCELSIVAVGTYSQLQNFFKGLMKDSNLNYLAEVEMQPWEKDRTILISNVKVRLYTKTPGAVAQARPEEAAPAPAAPASTPAPAPAPAPAVPALP